MLPIFSYLLSPDWERYRKGSNIGIDKQPHAYIYAFLYPKNEANYTPDTTSACVSFIHRCIVGLPNPTPTVPNPTPTDACTFPPKNVKVYSWCIVGRANYTPLKSFESVIKLIGCIVCRKKSPIKYVMRA